MKQDKPEVRARGGRPSRVSSFDIFDTIIYRTCGSPTGVLLRVGQELRKRHLIIACPDEFVYLRRLAERSAVNTSEGQEPQLDDIYQHLAKNLGWLIQESEIAKALEVRIELSTWRLVPGSAERIAAARSQCRRVAFLSDMYLPTAVVKQGLFQFGLIRPEDNLLVSGDHRKSKRNGKLFQLLAHQTKVELQEISHLGDCSTADVKIPKRLGVRASHFTKAKLTARERFILGRFAGMPGEALAGCARRVRLDHTLESLPAAIHAQTLASVVCTVASPTLWAYSEWLIRQARAAGIRRLYFMSRDGYVLKQFLARLCELSQESLDLRLIFGSRAALHPASLASPTGNYSWVFDKTDCLTWNILGQRLGFQADEVEMFFGKYAKKPYHPDDKIAPEAICQIKQALTDSSTVLEKLSAAGSRHLQNTIGYLRQEGFGDGVPSAFVDLGWTGRLHDSLNSILQVGGMQIVPGLFFGLRWGAETSQSIGNRSAFLFDERLGRACPVAVGQMAMVMETFCPMRQGSTIGYTSIGGRWVPSLRSEYDSALVSWGVDRVLDTYKTFLATLEADALLSSASENFLVSKVTDVLVDFIQRPSAEEAEHWGMFPFEDDQAGYGHQLIGRPLLSEGAASWRSALRGYSSPDKFAHWLAAAHRNTPTHRKVVWFLLAFPVRGIKYCTKIIRNRLKATNRIREVLRRLSIRVKSIPVAV